MKLTTNQTEMDLLSNNNRLNKDSLDEQYSNIKLCKND
jgi:hypothetical protein